MGDDEQADNMARLAAAIYKLSTILNVPIEEAAAIFVKVMPAVNQATENQKKTH